MLSNSYSSNRKYQKSRDIYLYPHPRDLLDAIMGIRAVWRRIWKKIE